MKTRAELKQEVKQLFKGRWRSAILLCIVVSLLSIFGILTQTSNGMNQATSHHATDYSSLTQLPHLSWQLLSIMTGAVLIVLLIQLVFYFVVKIFSVGTSYSMLDWVRNPAREIHPVSDSTIGFTKQYAWSIIGLQICQAVLTFLWSLLLIVPGIIKAFAYSQTYFVYKDLLAATPNGQPRPRYRDAITRSRQLMRGHKFEYFVLQLSFIGWALLSGLTMGIGQLWLTPYRFGVFAAYYDNLVTTAATD
ncbi:DUF975 family protein [Lactiplantibacillus pingfangensis]|uniref:DUF975 family protein n=1 Tax=Lactiplantibacillus pingfangensis TaxID=2559915 RepID=UPI0010F684F1|nr:DUF975 family protein [Lactiplantibacillus pingfangensis]